MVCIIQFVDGEIKGWLIATDTHDARRKAEERGLTDLARYLYSIEFPPRGMTTLPDGYWLLVD